MPGRRKVMSLRLPEVTPEKRLNMSWTPPGGHEVIPEPAPSSRAEAKPKASGATKAKSRAKRSAPPKATVAA